MIQSHLLIRSFLLLGALIFLGYRGMFLLQKHIFSYQQQSKKSHLAVPVLASSNEVWMNIFVHGSFGSALGFLSIPHVLDDKVSGTSYRAVTRRLRGDDSFFSEQAILQRGLMRIFPSFDLRVTKGKKYAAYPLIKAYDVVHEYIHSESSQQYYYTFGWSGLISQNSRRYEAVRFFNALYAEYITLKEQGKNPKIRLIAHSHGGNLCLNLAAVQSILRLKKFDSEQKFSQDEDTDKSLHAMFDIIKGLPSKNNMPPKVDQKIWDYVPVTSDLQIEELVLFGTPIQPETQAFCSFPIFKSVYNFYSNQDFIQRFDWVSTRRYFSDQRLVQKSYYGNSEQNKIINRVIQAQLVIGKHWSKRPTLQKNKSENSDSNAQSWWQGIFFGKKEAKRLSADPTHKELWFISWPDDRVQDFWLAPLPIVVLTPILLKLLESFNHVHDVDINIQETHESVKFQIADHQHTIIRKEQKISKSLIDMIKIKVNEWKPVSKTQKEEFNAVYKHVIE